MVEKKTSAPETPAAPAHVGNGLGVASLVTGIVAFVFGWVPFFGFAAGVVAVILGIIALKKAAGAKGFSIAGIITGGIGVLWSLIVTVIFFIALLALGTTGAAYGGVIKEANNALDQYNAENKALIEAKKDFAKGDTAKFGHFEVKVDKVQRDYVPADSYYKAGEGKEYVVVTVTVKNVDTESQSITTYDLKLNDAGTANMASFLVDVEPTFDGGDLSPKASLTGNLVFEVTKGSNDLKLQYETSAYDMKNSDVKNLTFTLKI